MLNYFTRNVVYYYRDRRDSVDVVAASRFTVDFFRIGKECGHIPILKGIAEEGRQEIFTDITALPYGSFCLAFTDSRSAYLLSTQKQAFVAKITCQQSLVEYMCTTPDRK